MLRIAAIVLLAACSSSSSSSPQGPSQPPPAPPGPPAPAGPGLGEPCAPGDVCREGQCVSYFGIAGARGPEFKSCEIKCDAGTACPPDLECITIADGPGQVCRKPAT